MKNPIKRELETINAVYSFFTHIPHEILELNTSAKLPFYISVKDSICTKGLPTSAGSPILQGYIPPYDATCIERINEAGGIIVGKTTMDEFGFGSFSTNTAIIPKNPHDTQRTCGGSSGGAAGITAQASFPHIALGQSTGGSIACPASFCGVVGLTPTYGRVSRHGLIDYANSLDKIGPLAKTVRECTLLLEIIAGPDGKDTTCVSQEKKFLDKLEQNVSALKIGVIREGFQEGIHPLVAHCVRAALARLTQQKKDVSLPITSNYGIPTYYLIALTEASTNLARYAGLRYGREAEIQGKEYDEYFSEIRTSFFGPEAKRRIILGTFARMAGFRDSHYLKAMKLRTHIIQEYKELFKTHDVLASPTMPIVAPTFEEIKKLTPLQHFMMDILTVGPNLAGLPHISVPCGFVKGMPVGIQFIADHFNEGKLLAIAHHYEKVRGNLP